MPKPKFDYQAAAKTKLAKDKQGGHGRKTTSLPPGSVSFNDGVWYSNTEDRVIGYGKTEDGKIYDSPLPGQDIRKLRQTNVISKARNKGWGKKI